MEKRTAGNGTEDDDERISESPAAIDALLDELHLSKPHARLTIPKRWVEPWWWSGEGNGRFPRPIPAGREPRRRIRNSSIAANGGATDGGSDPAPQPGTGGDDGRQHTVSLSLSGGDESSGRAGTEHGDESEPGASPVAGEGPGAAGAGAGSSSAARERRVAKDEKLTKKEEAELLKREQAGQSAELLTTIFATFRAARQQDAKSAFLALQDEIAAHAGDLVRLNLCGMKELVDLLMKLNDARKEEGEEDKSNESALQAFLRKADDAEGMTQ